MSQSDLESVAVEDVELTDQEESDLAQAMTAAGRRGYDEALAAGLSVTVAIGDGLYKVDPNGTKRKIKDLPPSIPIEPGTRFKLR